MTIKIKKGTEEDLIKLVNNTDGLCFGYIGNFEQWGDDRTLHIWVPGSFECNGNRVSIWSQHARCYDRKDYFRAVQAMKSFTIGRNSVN